MDKGMYSQSESPDKEERPYVEYTSGDSLPQIASPSIKPGPYDAANADKRHNQDFQDKMDKLRKIIKPGG
jgi:hypothetical protein